MIPDCPYCGHFAPKCQCEELMPDWMCSPEDEEFHFAQGIEAASAAKTATEIGGLVHESPRITQVVSEGDEIVVGER